MAASAAVAGQQCCVAPARRSPRSKCRLSSSGTVIDDYQQLGIVPLFAEARCLGRAVMSKRWIALAGACTAMLYAAIARVAAAPEQQPARPVAAVSPQRALIDRYCATCHNERLRTGGLSLSAAEVDPLQVADDVETWEKVVRKLRARAMPPAGPGRPRPDETELRGAGRPPRDGAGSRRRRTAPIPGAAEPFRRLNRTEYRNAVRDLLDARRGRRRSLLPADDCELRVRQRQRRGSVADVDGALPCRGPEGQPAGGRQPVLAPLHTDRRACRRT